MFSFNFWVLFGAFGTFLFFSRFFVQWIYSEYHKKSIVPKYFWYLSITGSLVLVVYSYHIQDPIFFFGQLFALLVYIRNIALVNREEREKQGSV